MRKEADDPAHDTEQDGGRPGDAGTGPSQGTLQARRKRARNNFDYGKGEAVPFIANLARKQLIKNPDIKRWVLNYLRCSPGLLYAMIKEVVGRDACGYKPEEVTHVVLIIGTRDKTSFTSGGCVHISGPISGQGECGNPSHIYIACEMVMETLKERHSSLPQLLERSRASLVETAEAKIHPAIPESRPAPE
jgi:hypothetical protein